LDDIESSERLENSQAALQEEVGEWDRLEVQILDVAMNNHVRMNMYIGMLLEKLSENGTIDRTEFEAEANERMVIELQKLREQITPAVRQQRMRAAGIELPNGRHMTIPKDHRRKH